MEISTRLGVRDHPPDLHAKDLFTGLIGRIGSVRSLGFQIGSSHYPVLPCPMLFFIFQHCLNRFTTAGNPRPLLHLPMHYCLPSTIGTIMCYYSISSSPSFLWPGRYFSDDTRLAIFSGCSAFFLGPSLFHFLFAELGFRASWVSHRSYRMTSCIPCRRRRLLPLLSLALAQARVWGLEVSGCREAEMGREREMRVRDECGAPPFV